jgi:hypothetical protein
MSSKNKYDGIKRRRMPFYDEMDPNVFGSPRGPNDDDEDFKLVQCLNGHWTYRQDIDEHDCCSQCQAEGLIPKEDKGEV